ncbi:hypothetical protein [Specibacter cremeus]|uniref:hypothetical protein n=1 Tax=Specibacter cremeus TaxID=1629051 RepID=UPI000F7AEC1D|nr:hypothetical protein [Specibacter cremeus]
MTVEVDGRPSPTLPLPSAPASPPKRGLSALLARADQGDSTPAADRPARPASPAATAFGAALDAAREAVPVVAPPPSRLALTASAPGAARPETAPAPSHEPSPEPSPEPSWEPSAELSPVPDDDPGWAAATEPPVVVPGSPDVPAPAAGPGDLVVLVGIRDQPLHVARTMARELRRGAGAELRTAGDHRAAGVEHVIVDGSDVKKAQALAAVAGRPLLIAFSVGERTSSNPFILAAVRPDQLWLVVDALHKPEDTAAWVRQISWFSTPDAVAVLGAGDTATPESINELGYPVGWVDGRPAAAPTL